MSMKDLTDDFVETCTLLEDTAVFMGLIAHCGVPCGVDESDERVKAIIERAKKAHGK